MLSFGESVGDHRSIVFDVKSRSLLGQYEQPVVRAGCRRLTTKNGNTISRYQELLDEQMAIHRMHERLDYLIEDVGDGPATEEQAGRMEEKQLVEIQQYAERRCRQIIKADLEFSPTVKLWHKWMQLWRAIIRWKEGKPCDGSNLVRKAVGHGVKNPQQLTLADARAGHAYAEARKHQLRTIAPELRRDLLRAEADSDKATAKAVKQKTQREQKGKMW